MLKCGCPLTCGSAFQDFHLLPDSTIPIPSGSHAHVWHDSPAVLLILGPGDPSLLNKALHEPCVELAFNGHDKFVIGHNTHHLQHLLRYHRGFGVRRDRVDVDETSAFGSGRFTDDRLESKFTESRLHHREKLARPTRIGKAEIQSALAFTHVFGELDESSCWSMTCNENRPLAISTK